MSQSQESENINQRDEVFCCGNQSLPKVFLLIFGFGAFVGFIDYFLVKGDLNRRHRGDITKYYRQKNLGVSMDVSFDNYVAYYGKSYADVKEFNTRKSLFETNRQEL